MTTYNKAIYCLQTLPLPSDKSILSFPGQKLGYGGTEEEGQLTSRIPACPCEKPAGPPTKGIQHLLAFSGVQSIPPRISVAAVGTVVAPAFGSSLWECECQLVLSARGDDATKVLHQGEDNGHAMQL